MKQKIVYIEKKPSLFSRINNHFKVRNERIAKKILAARLEKLEKAENIKKLKLHKNKMRLNFLQSMTDLKETSKVNLNEVISDLRYFKPKFWNRVKGKMFPVNTCLAVIHYPQGVDVIRHFKMPKPFVLDINGKLNLFSPKAFRYINGKPKLEFYANIPFAIVHNVTDKYIPPSLDTDAFTSVQKSKFIQDASTVNDGAQMGGLMIAVIIVLALCFIIGIITLSNILQIMQKLPK